MSLHRLLVANRGEIAIRVLRAAAELGIRTVAVHSEDDARCLHVTRADEVRQLQGVGAAAYLDGAQILRVATEAGCDALHPGYGFLSEDASFARSCADAGIRFVGPQPDTLDLLGDKVQARALADRCGVPILAGTDGSTSVEEAKAFLNSLAEGEAMMIKAVAGGGGRGIRAVHRLADVEQAFERCQSEARVSFGNEEVYVERLLVRARHVEVQIVGDGSGQVSHVHERECSIQRRNQKLVEIAPSPSLSEALRRRIIEAAVALAKQARYTSLGTFEFLVEVPADGGEGTGVGDEAAFAFIEANPRLQVEHTVTEQVTGVDLVTAQLQIAGGASLADLHLEQSDIPEPRGHAMQVRINMEKMAKDGSPRPTGGTLTAFDMPSGPGLRTDSFGYAGYETSPRYDSLLAKLIGYSASRDFSDVVSKTYRGLCEFKIEGVGTNIPFLQALLSHPDVQANRVYTRFIEENAADLVAESGAERQRLFFDADPPAAEAPAGRALAGARVDGTDPLAVLDHGKSEASHVGTPATQPAAPNKASHGSAGPPGTIGTMAPLQGTIVSIDVSEDASVHEGQQLLIMEAMKMEHVIRAPTSGIVRRIEVHVGDPVFEGHALVFIEEADVGAVEASDEARVDLDRIRPDLAEVRERHEVGLDPARPDAVARRRKTGQRTTRENVEDLCDAGSFFEYGALVIAAQRRRRSLEDLIAKTPADGMIAGIGTINGDLFSADEAMRESDLRCVVMSYDYTVLAGTQGAQNHRKKDRMFELAEKSRLPVVFFTEGGGGRPGDTDSLGVAGLDCLAFNYFGKLSGLVPLVGINSGRCFAGNAALLGCCDVVIATEGSNIGMGGPAMIEGGGLGIFRPEEVGPMEVQVRNGVVDIAVQDEIEAVEVAKKYLSYFQGDLPNWECADQRLLRAIIPENRLRVYDVRGVIETLADTGSVLELRRGFGLGMVTAFIRVEGRPLGIIANNPEHLAGAIDSEGADKAARFMQLCDAFDIPLVMLCDTPGIMVGPEVEKTALVRHASRMFVTGASLSVPIFTIVLRKGYGLGAQAMAAGSFKAPLFTISWPTGEFGGMGLEGAVKLGFRKELAAIDDPEQRRATFEEMVDRMYTHGKAVNMASHFEIDEVIDPMDSRAWITRGLQSAPPPPPRDGKKRPCVDTW